MMRFLFFYSLIALFSLSVSYDYTSLAQCTSQCSQGCSSCQNFTCTSCHDGYTFVSATATCSANLCTISNCDLCGQKGECVKCSNEYAVYDPTTNACLESCSLPNCQRCRAGSLSCELCNSGYALYSWDNTCRVSQVSNCLVYHDWRGEEYQCSLCESGFRPTADRTECIPDSCPSIENCQSCSAPSTCTLCRLGFSVNNGLCEANNCPVQDCLRCHASGVCVSCASGYKLSGLQCVPDVCSLQNCQRCKPSSIFCDECKSGYVYEVVTNKCVQITDLTPSPLNCESMRKFGSLLVCLNCLQGYKFADDNHIKCIKNCSAGCSECQNSYLCKSCSPGFKVSSGECSPYSCAVPGCSLCNSTGACIECTDIYYRYNNVSGSCVLSCQIEHCLRCKVDSTICQQCQQGYALNLWTGTCIFSPISSCMVLHDWRDQQFQCSRCKQGFRPTQDNFECISEACLALPDCQTCSNASTCTRCRTGYSLTNGQCVLNPCSTQNCLYCNPNGACLRPHSNYYMVKSLFVQKTCRIPNCASCTPNSIFCKACHANYNYDIWNNKCVQSGVKIIEDKSESRMNYLWFLLIIPGIIGIIVAYRFVRQTNSVVNAKEARISRKDILQPKVFTEDDINSGRTTPALQFIKNSILGKQTIQAQSEEVPKPKFKKLPPIQHKPLPLASNDSTMERAGEVSKRYQEDCKDQALVNGPGDELTTSKIEIPSIGVRQSNHRMKQYQEQEYEEKQ